MSQIEGGAPTFPSPGLVAKIKELGFGSGPWSRAELGELLGESAANKVIQEAKELGWLVSPFRNSFFVPSASDLMLTSWLPRLQRQEFIISRTLAASGFRFWCFSSWARASGVVFPEPLFVTDLSPMPKQPPAILSTASEVQERTQPDDSLTIARRNGSIAANVSKLPFMENLIIVPDLPQSGTMGLPIRVVLPQGRPKKASPMWTAYAESSGVTSRGDSISPSDVSPRVLRYTLTPDVDDPAWTVALAYAMEIPRMRERLQDIVEAGRQRAERKRVGRNRLTKFFFESRVGNWAATLGPPEPNSRWKPVLSSGRYPYLLVPDSLWQEMSSAVAARRMGELDQLKRA